VYTQFAKWYDLHYRSIKNYGEECERLAYLLEKLDPIPQNLLDVCCGTGEHARILGVEHGFLVDGIDREPNLIEIAQEKNPDSSFSIADMRRFSLTKRYDAITCLFSSIGYVETEKALGEAIESMAKHLNPSGWLIIEPWIEPEEWDPALVKSSRSVDRNSGVVIEQRRTARTEGSVSVLEIEYKIDTPDEHIVFEERHRLGLFSRDQIETALKRSGYRSRYIPNCMLPHQLHIALLVG
jgi:SAM-dependent methyltransferase